MKPAIFNYSLLGSPAIPGPPLCQLLPDPFETPTCDNRETITKSICSFRFALCALLYARFAPFRGNWQNQIATIGFALMDVNRQT